MSVRESIDGFWFCIKLAGIFFAIFGFEVGRGTCDLGWRKKCRKCQNIREESEQAPLGHELTSAGKEKSKLVKEGA
ncbi:MAG: hypothetical protein AB1611_09325 [bacterium]